MRDRYFKMRNGFDTLLAPKILTEIKIKNMSGEKQYKERIVSPAPYVPRLRCSHPHRIFSIIIVIMRKREHSYVTMQIFRPSPARRGPGTAAPSSFT